MAIPPFPSWKDRENLPEMLVDQAAKYETILLIDDWKSLNPLQRYALIKLSRPGHENRNFPIAMTEFGLINESLVICEATK